MTYNIKIDIHTIPLTGIWCGTNEWCKAGDVAHLCSIMATMYNVLDRLKDSDGISEAEHKAVAFALKRAHEVMP